MDNNIENLKTDILSLRARVEQLELANAAKTSYVAGGQSIDPIVAAKEILLSRQVSAKHEHDVAKTQRVLEQPSVATPDVDPVEAARNIPINDGPQEFVTGVAPKADEPRIILPSEVETTRVDKSKPDPEPDPKHKGKKH